MPRKDVNRKEGQTSTLPNPAPPRRMPGGSYAGGKHFRDTPAGPDDLQRNPGIGSSPGTRASGESGIKELDEGGGIRPREK